MTTEILITICGIFALAGFVKGTIGFGLPTIGIGLGALISDIPTAMMLILGPTILTNFFQIVRNGSLINVITKTWPFMLASTIFVPLGLLCVVDYPGFPFERLLGGVISLYSLASLRGFQWIISDERKSVVGIFSGLVNSLLTGMTGSFSVPGIMYLRTFEFSKDDLVCAMGLLFLLSTITMGGSLFVFGKATPLLSFLSLCMCIPVGLGVFAGSQVKRVLTEVQFTQIFLWAFLVLGLYLIVFGG